MCDEQLALTCQGGDKSAWEKLYTKYKPVVLATARRFFLSGGETEDLVQEGMCGLYSAVVGFKSGSGSFSAYAGKCIRNRILDAVKLSNAAKHSPLNNCLSIAEIEQWLAFRVNPEDEIIDRETQVEFVQKIKGALSPFEYKVITMYTDGLTLCEISDELNKKVKSIDNAINRAKNKLHNLLTE